MRQKFSWMLLVLLAFSVYAEDEKAVVVGSAKELKGITAKKIIWEKDGAKMVRIPSREKRYDRTGNLISLYMDVTEVTVSQFKKFLRAEADHPFYSDLWEEIYEVSPTDEHPMVEVTWHDATAYAKWAGKRLPTEEEWEWAARGGLKNKVYSWGDDKSLARDYANCEGIGGKDKWEYCAPVGSFQPNGYGLYDMAGNVWEWCQDWYDSNENSRVLRGGSWLYGTANLQVDNRSHDFPSIIRLNHGGFRCVAGLR